MKRDEYIIVHQPGQDDLRVQKCKAIAGSELFEKAFNNEMKENSTNTFEATTIFHPTVWSTVLAAVQGNSIDTAILDADLKFNTLELIDFLSPKDTNEGDRLVDLLNMILEQLLISLKNGTTQHKQAIHWALVNDNLRALATTDSGELKHVISHMDLKDLSPKILEFLVQLPDFEDVMDAPHGLWDCWKRMPLQTERGEDLRDALKPRLRFTSASPTSNVLACGTELIRKDGGELKIFDINTTNDGWITTAMLSAPNFRPTDLAVSGTYIVGLGWKRKIVADDRDNGLLCIWSAVQPYKLLYQFSCPDAVCVAVCEDSAVTVQKDDSIQVWSIVTGKQQLKIPIQNWSVTRVSLGRSILVMEDAKEKKLNVFERETGTAILSLDSITSHVLHGNVLYTAKSCDSIQSWIRSGNSMKNLHQVRIDCQLNSLFCEGTTLGGVVGGRWESEIAIKKWDLSTGKSLSDLVLSEARGVNTLSLAIQGLIVNYYAGDKQYVTEIYGKELELH
jgi:hypothetical protein